MRKPKEEENQGLVLPCKEEKCWQKVWQHKLSQQLSDMNQGIFLKILAPSFPSFINQSI